MIAALYLVPALVWAILTERTWHFARTRRPRSWLIRMLPLVTGVMTLHLCVEAALGTIPADILARRTPAVTALRVANDLAIIASLALFRHLVRFIPLRGDRPGRGWLAWNYGPAVVLATLSLFLPSLVPGSTLERQVYLFVATMHVWMITMMSLIVVELARIARRGLWTPGELGQVRLSDAAIVAVILLVAGLSGAGLVAGGRLHEQPSTRFAALDATAHLALAVPLAVRILGEVLPRFVIGLATLGAVGVVYLAAEAVGLRVGPELRSLVDLCAVATLGVLLLPARERLAAAVDRIVFRGTRRRQEDVATFLTALGPDLGVEGCCRRALAEFARLMRLRGAAIVLADGAVFSEGRIEAAPLAAAWRAEGAEADARFPTGFGTLETLGLPARLRDALGEAQIVGVFAIASRRRRWGHLFMTRGLLGTVITDEDARVMRTFGDQLALVLDAAELLARAVAVERSLAHAEKLAAIGELAARVAHEIRNPVTAARSLAQQLGREPASPLNVEHAELIVTELERVEHQVATLLRFARRDELAFAPVDLAELVRAVVADLGRRLDGDRVMVDVASASGVTVRADRDRLRQVLVNLIENAADALRDTAGTRRVAIAVGRANGNATVTVRDNGPGVPADALPRLFEPFFSLKPHGTGLGLAIARRTVEAHGGRIEAASAERIGAEFRIELPLAAGNER